MSTTQNTSQIHHNVGFVDNASSWEDAIGNNTWSIILQQIEGSKDNPEKLKQIVDQINTLQGRHAGIRQASDNQWDANRQYTSDEVGSYQTDYGKYGSDGIDPNYNFNDKTIGVVPKESRYSYPSNPNSGDAAAKKWTADRIYGAQTDDRRLLGRNINNNDEYANLLQSKNEALKPYGLELFLDNDNYYKIRYLDQQATTSNINGVESTDLPWVNKGMQLQQKLKNIDWVKLAENWLPIHQKNFADRLNRKNLNLMLQTPTYLEQPYRLETPVHGDLATENYYHQVANNTRNLGAYARTSDALINNMSRLAAEEKANEYDLKGYLADNEMITKTASVHTKTENGNIDRYNEIGNRNNKYMLAQQAADIEAKKQYNTTQFQNKLTLFKDLLANAQKYRNEKNTIKANILKLMMPSSENDPEVLTAKTNMTLAKNSKNADLLTRATKQYNDAVAAANKRILLNYYNQLANISGYNFSDEINNNNETNTFSYILNSSYKTGGRLIPKAQLGRTLGDGLFNLQSWTQDRWSEIKNAFKGGSQNLGNTISTAFSGGLNGNLGNTINNASNFISSALGDPSEYSGTSGEVAQTADEAYDSIQNLAGSIPVYGQAIQAVMGANKTLGKVAKKLGGGTDGMTDTDALLGSSFLQMTPFGLVNGFGGKKTHTLEDKSKQLNLLYGDQAMSGFSGTQAGVNETMAYSGKKYGLFSSSARRKANRAIDRLNQQQSQIADIAASTKNAFDIQAGMNEINTNATAFDLNSGYQQGAVRMGETGMKFEYMLEKPFEYILTLDTPKEESRLIEEFQRGGQMNVIPEGNLHARLHHMENADSFTKKGIPVVDNDGVQQAEIELNEIIFNKETTEKLEKYWKDGSDEAAIKAGKLLAKEIIENTEDRTGLIKTIK